MSLLFSGDEMEELQRSIRHLLINGDPRLYVDWVQEKSEPEPVKADTHRVPDTLREMVDGDAEAP